MRFSTSSEMRSPVFRRHPGQRKAQGRNASQLPSTLKLAVTGPCSYTSATEITIGYARGSTRSLDLKAQRNALMELGVTEDRI